MIQYLLPVTVLLFMACSQQRPAEPEPSAAPLTSVVLDAMQEENDPALLTAPKVTVSQGSTQAHATFIRKVQFIEDYEVE